VRDAHIELREMLVSDREARLSSIADVLAAEAAKLAAIERRVLGPGLATAHERHAR
jgi:hypothetical protein